MFFLFSQYLQIFLLDEKLAINWTDDDTHLLDFAVISYLKLIRLLMMKDNQKLESVKQKFLNNIAFSLNSINNEHLLWSVFIAFIDLKIIELPQHVREEIFKHFNFDEELIIKFN